MRVLIVDGRVALLGDTAHPMYPTGSNGASQATVDARVLGAMLLEHGVTPAALAAYDQRLCGPINALVQRNRGAGARSASWVWWTSAAAASSTISTW